VPSFAAPPLAKTILEEMQRISAPYGTKIQIDGDVGIIRP
jgi:poly-gamma-glutamate synthesis protein (capsule biosynthesis protein)